ncbi:hypothetical protein PF005_g23958 [Phytophthora fragariae]|uniref:Retrotransposon gag domain-containing protein n=1 Tax=Phytophthora fragariae TaxID=53985 RepID=A0A6A3W4A3_9STRA|nr:hypothetical protein PF009_g25708 [Phytophthora fragariae]KAE9178723.1 hypothetical protein PF005_g23958 [Phytophthora fragariae]KAE9212007.1 hypothetical protein PF002_g18369 [Phytophthora fragariae]
MPVSMWLKTVRQEVRRQAVTMGVEWNENQLYHEVASHLDGEAKRWFATVMESVQLEEESINTLATMLRAKYMTQRSGPEVVDLLNARRQMRGDRLVDYAQALREIAERGEIGDDWQVSAFLKGMSSVTGATHGCGHRPKTLDEALKVAIPQVGDYGEGYGIRLEEAMTAWDAREGTSGHGPLVATKSPGGGAGQSAVGGNTWNVVTGYGAGWSAAPKPPRYDTEGRPVDTGKTGTGAWWKAIPPGYKLVPAGTTSGTTGGSKIQSSGGQARGEGGKRPSNDQGAKRPAKTFKVESKYGGGGQEGRGGPTNPSLATREGRLRNHGRYVASRTPARPFVPRDGTECFYCGLMGHFAPEVATGTRKPGTRPSIPVRLVFGRVRVPELDVKQLRMGSGTRFGSEF